MEVACKTFTATRKEDVKEEFEKEMENLKILRDALAKHERIATFMAIISIGTEFSILSPLAEMDLGRFLYNEDQDFQARFEITPKQMIAESSKLVHALHHLHDKIHTENLGHFICCHMDLKTENILVYMDDLRNGLNPVGK